MVHTDFELTLYNWYIFIFLFVFEKCVNIKKNIRNFIKVANKLGKNQKEI